MYNDLMDSQYLMGARKRRRSRSGSKSCAKSCSGSSTGSKRKYRRRRSTNVRSRSKKFIDDEGTINVSYRMNNGFIVNLPKKALGPTWKRIYRSCVSQAMPVSETFAGGYKNLWKVKNNIDEHFEKLKFDGKVAEYAVTTEGVPIEYNVNCPQMMNVNGGTNTGFIPGGFNNEASVVISYKVVGGDDVKDTNIVGNGWNFAGRDINGYSYTKTFKGPNSTKPRFLAKAIEQYTKALNEYKVYDLVIDGLQITPNGTYGIPQSNFAQPDFLTGIGW